MLAQEPMGTNWSHAATGWKAEDAHCQWGRVLEHPPSQGSPEQTHTCVNHQSVSGLGCGFSIATPNATSFPVYRFWLCNYYLIHLFAPKHSLCVCSVLLLCMIWHIIWTASQTTPYCIHVYLHTITSKEYLWKTALIQNPHCSLILWKHVYAFNFKWVNFIVLRIIEH